MSKCEHGDKITVFCVSDSCAWKEAAGCPVCIKKYHSHIGTTLFLSEEDVTVIVKKYNVEQSVKPKCRLLQEAIFNYLNLVKTELTNSMDVVCKNIINQIGYPYLNNTNTLAAYKRLKNKEYRKLMSKQFKLLYEQSLKLNEKQLIKEQAVYYKKQTLIAMEALNNIEAIAKNYEAAIKGVFPGFVHDGSSINKITEIIKSLQVETGKEIKSESPDSKPKEVSKVTLAALLLSTPAEPKNQYKLEKQRNENEQLNGNRHPNGTLHLNGTQNSNTKPSSHGNHDASSNQMNYTTVGHTRDVSLDTKMGKSKNQVEKSKISDKSKDSLQEQMKEKPRSQKQIALLHNNSSKMQTLKQELNHKEVEINEKKRILIDMMKSKQPKVSFDKQLQEGTNKKETSVSNQSKLPRQTSARSKKHSDINCESEDSEEDFPKIQSVVKNYAFTKLPLQQSLAIYKKTEEQEQVHKKLIVVPKDSCRVAELDSPIYRKRSTLSKMEQSKFKEYGIEDKSTDSNIANAYWGKPSNLAKKQEVELKENEEKSLALLIKSLHLKAEEAVTYLESAFRYADNNLSVAEYLSYIYLELNRPKQCLEICNRMLQKLKNSREAEQLSIILTNNKSAAFNMMGRYSESIRVLEECLKYRQNDSLYKNLGDAYFSLSIYEKAIYSYEKALKMNDDFDEVHYNLAVCLYIQENYHNARLSIRKALEQQPKNEQYLQLSSNIETKLRHL